MSFYAHLLILFVINNRILYAAISIFTFNTDSFAIPHQLTQQGRLLDTDGIPLEGIQSVEFRLYNDPFSGSLMWSETQNIQMNNGFYAVILGGDVNNNPLDDQLLMNNTLF